MVRNIVLAGIFATLLVASAGAEPLEFGARGQLIFSADRVSPLFSYARIKQTDNDGNVTTTSTTSMSLLWAGAPQDFYDIPRAGLDYAIAPNITIGGTLFATLPMSSSRSSTQNGTTVTRDSAKMSFFGFGARVGYVMPLSPRLAFWPRGGLSWSHEGITNPAGNNGGQVNSSISQPALNLEPMFVLQPTVHVGITLGPVLDLPLGGTQHTELTDNGRTVSTDTDASQLHFGITVGLLGWI